MNRHLGLGRAAWPAWLIADRPTGRVDLRRAVPKKHLEESTGGRRGTVTRDTTRFHPEDRGRTRVGPLGAVIRGAHAFLTANAVNGRTRRPGSRWQFRPSAHAFLRTIPGK